MKPALFALTLAVPLALPPDAEGGSRFEAMDVFELEYASDPRISPDGREVVYVRNFMDRMSDRKRSKLWRVSVDGTGHRPVAAGSADESSPRYSPDGTRLVFLSRVAGGESDGNGNASQVHVHWLASGETTRISSVPFPPEDLTWSPDGRWIAFTMFVPDKPEPMVKLPEKPEGATWADPPVVIEKMLYRSDGDGYLPDGSFQVFVLPAEGGTARAVTDGAYRASGPLVWSPEGDAILFTSNRRDDWERHPKESEIYEVALAGGEPRALTARPGPDRASALSPDGGTIAYTGYEDREQGYQVERLSVMNRDGSGARILTPDFDRDVEGPVWTTDGAAIVFRYDDEGVTALGMVPAGGGEVTRIASGLGGTTLGRPYASGDFSPPIGGQVACTLGSATRPADLAVVGLGTGEARGLTDLNSDALGHKELAQAEAFRCPSSHDGLGIQGWLMKPPGFEAGRRYPLLLEIHGGPFLNYGPRFAAEMQLYAAAGYVVAYANPRGSTSYGEAFGNAIHHAYPGHDYDDLMSVVDHLVATGIVDEERMFVTGGSGGGVLTAWIVGKTDRFAAAVAAKPVINWTSFALTADHYPFFHRYWFPQPPWEAPEHYWARSPLSLVGNVTTPTMLLTGEADYRTPISESEQYYQALKIRQVDTALVRIPGASHGITSRPSRLIAKAAHVLAWFARYGGPPVPGGKEGEEASEGD